MMSLVRAAAAGEDHGTFVTIVTQPASTAVVPAGPIPTDPLTAPVDGGR